MSEVLHWTEYLKAFGPVIIAGVVAYIAYEQWRISRANFREKLFDRRFEIYDLARDVLIDCQMPSDGSAERSRDFGLKRRAALFLFDVQLAKFLEDVHNDSHRIQFLERILSRIPGDSPNWEKNVDEQEKIRDRLLQYSNEIDKVFAPYLEISKFEDPASKYLSIKIGRLMGILEHNPNHAKRK